jgi:dolichol kinase
LGSLVTVLVFPPDIASLAILFLALGDPAATIVGTWKGQTRFWGKSLEGNIACLVACLLVAVVVVTARDYPPLLAAVVGAFVATVFGALPLRINDNITIPFGSALAMLLMRLVI